MNVKEFQKEVRKEYEAIAHYTIRAPWFRWLNISLVVVSMLWLGFYVAYHQKPKLLFDLLKGLV
jgi:hypothetical protein